ncbi:glycerate kinase [Erysipelatoclostridium sp. An173]|uniref:glycerate kinase family protein n=1 Tax=Erysipelatoclostridium sp. An173 TaxID=1965571 RepID=UPI000B37341A|nr:glycerate kinase [Erysipelatoclostridium sp. An173]OUP77994.1 glycerate kinase [Erysipelatoclostridium sp. An173]
MKVVVAIDSLKGSLSSLEAGNAIKQGIKRVYQDAKIIVKPLADGGEGTVEALVSGMNGKIETVVATGPLGDKIESSYGIIPEKRLAIMEMASIAGITLLSLKQRNPLYTTTYGLGEMIKDAISKGCNNFIIGIGGSATNDGGIGMLQALGFDLLDKDGNQVPLGARGLKDLVKIDDKNVLPELKKCQFKIACDVTNVLCGENGCSVVFGPQKGATSQMIKDMDQWLYNFANLAKKKYPHSDALVPGTGAAGGLGFAFLTFVKATLESGIDIILETIDLKSDLKDADVVVTGEGCLDRQSAMGKAPVGVAKMAKLYNKPVIAFAGSVTKEAKLCNQEGIDAYFPIIRNITTLQEAMAKENAKNNLTDTVEQVFRLWKIKQ